MNKAAKYSLFLILLILFGIFALIGGSSYFEDLHSAKIARTGTETTAVVYDAEGWADEDEDPYWLCVLFYYYDNADQIHYGKTNTAYTWNEAVEIYNAGEMKIKYNEKFEAVAADFKYSYNFGAMAAMFYVGITGIAGAVVYFVIITLQVKKENNVKKNGHSAVATFVSKNCNVYINGSPRYRIVYKFIASEEGGEERTIKSKELFTLDNAVYYEANKQFNIKYSGKISIITEKPYSRTVNREPNNLNNSEPNTIDSSCEEHNNCDFNSNEFDVIAPDENILCEHCAAHLSPKDKRCPNCGAKVRKK